MKLKQSDSLEFLKENEDYGFDIMYADPPYALGSEIVIREDGKVDYKKAVDFMNKWDMPTGTYWEKWFKEAYRTLKHGGYLIMFGMDRQLLLFKYYANLAGFTEQQSLYWYYISNFPKSTDLSKMIDKNAGVKREIVSKNKGVGSTNNKLTYSSGHKTEYDLTNPSTDLAQKYEGYKYSVSPLKQTNETIMVFQKSYKTGSCLHDTLAYENGDKECCCGALDIDGNRVPSGEKLTRELSQESRNSEVSLNASKLGAGSIDNIADDLGRYPAQAFIDSEVAEVLDKQSGIRKGNGKINYASKTNRKGLTENNPVFNTKKSGIDTTKGEGLDNYGDTGGCSKILHKCNYEQEDYDIFNYQPKVSKSERNAGLDGFENLEFSSKVPVPQRAERPFNSIKNNHPTLKPIALNEKILRLFKTPNKDQKICYPFAGSGSEIIGGIKAGFDNWVGCEINEDYVEIAKARIEHWTNHRADYEEVKEETKEMKEIKPLFERCSLI